MLQRKFKNHSLKQTKREISFINFFINIVLKLKIISIDDLDLDFINQK